MNEVLKFLRENPTFYIATEDGDQPRVRPFGAIAEFEGKLYIVTGNQKKVYAQMIQNPKVEISVADDKGNWLRVEATVVRDSKREAKEKMLADNDNLTGIYTLDDGIMEVFYLKDATATFYSFTAEPRTVTF